MWIGTTTRSEPNAHMTSLENAEKINYMKKTRCPRKYKNKMRVSVKIKHNYKGNVPKKYIAPNNAPS